MCEEVGVQKKEVWTRVVLALRKKGGLLYIICVSNGRVVCMCVYASV